MSSSTDYRTNAEDCLRMAVTSHDAADKPFWLTLAQSWLRLAERSARGDEPEAETPRLRGGRR